MPGEALKLSITQEDGAPPSALNARSTLGESSVSEVRARFRGAIYISATRWRRHLLYLVRPIAVPKRSAI
jgi:hypothetical protein